MGSKGSSQAAPDYTGAAIAEGEALRENVEAQTYANRSDQVNPWGSNTWSNQQVWDPATQQNVNKWTERTSLAAPLQQGLNEQMNMAMLRSRMANTMTSRAMTEENMSPMNMAQFGGMQDYERNGPVNLAGIPGRDYDLQGDTVGPEQMQRQLNLSNAPQLGGQNMMQTTGFQDPGLGGQTLQTDLDYSGASEVGTGAEQRQRAEDAIYDRGASRLDRRMQQGGDDLEVKLRGQGLQPGDQAYDRAMRDFNEQKTDAYQTLGNEAIMGGGQEATRTFGMDMDRRGMMTGEQDRMGEYRNQALSGQFGLDAQRQAQMQQVAQSEAGFGNQARQSQFGIDAERRAASVGETGMMGDYYNQAAQGQYGMNQGAAQQRFEQGQAGAEFRNQQRDQAINEQLTVGQENRSRNREWIDQQNQQRQQAINEATQQRAQGMNEVTAWMQGQQVQAPQFQQYNQAGVAGAPQLLQAAGMQGQQQAANLSAQNAASGGMMSGLGSLAGGMMAMSDRRLKRNIKRIGTKAGYPWYSFQYIWGVESQGVMADEIPAEFRIPMGDYDMVNYEGLLNG